MPLSEFPFATVSVRGDRAEQLLLQMRTELQPRGQVPIIIGDEESATRLVEGLSWGQFSFDDALRSATTLPPEEWFQQQIAEDPKTFGLDLDTQIYPKGTAPMTHLQVGFDCKGTHLAEVFIAKLPTSDYWAAPLHLRFGAWNACPEPFTHAMLARYWEQQYGARIAALTSDTIEFTVDRPPVSAEDCSKLALQQYIYAPDIVDQGVGSVPTLAQALRGSSRWFFWWD